MGGPNSGKRGQSSSQPTSTTKPTPVQTPKKRKAATSSSQPIDTAKKVKKTHKSSTAERNHEIFISSELDDSEMEEGGFEKIEMPKDRRTSGSTLAADEDNAELDDIDSQEKILEESARQEPRTPRHKPARNDSPPSSKIKDTSRLTADIKGSFNELLYQCRIAYLTQFNLDRVAPIIRAVWGDEIKRYDWEWIESRRRLSWNSTNWKTRCISNMVMRIADYIKKDSAGVLAAIKTTKALVQWFAAKYSPSAFIWVFDFASGAVDVVDTDATDDEWHFFFKSIWSMFGARVKLYMDWSQDEERRVKSPNSRRNLLLWMNKMAISEKYAACSSLNLVKVEGKQRRSAVVEDEPDFPDDDTEYFFAGTPPPSQRPVEKDPVEKAPVEKAPVEKDPGAGSAKQKGKQPAR